MSSVGVGTGHPDGEDRAMPHGGVLTTGANLSVSGTTNLPGISGFVEVAGYRSIVVQIKNLGTRDLTITPEWDFFDGAAHIRSTEGQKVLAGTSKRLLFQNQGDIINKIAVTGGGAGDTIHYYVTGSNLDPLPRSAPDYLILQGISRTINDPPIGDEDHGKFDPATAVSNDLSLWTFILDAGGRIKEVDVSAPGRYQSFVTFKWPAAGAAYQKTTLIDIFGVGPIPMSPSWSTVSATQEEASLPAFTELIQGTAQFDINLDQNSGGPIAFVAPLWWIIRHAL